MYVCMYVMCVCMYVCMYVCVYVCMYVMCVCVCMYVCVYVCVLKFCHFRDVRSHGLLVVATLCCCVARCELQPVVITATSEEVTLDLHCFVLSKLNQLGVCCLLVGRQGCHLWLCPICFTTS